MKSSIDHMINSKKAVRPEILLKSIDSIVAESDALTSPPKKGSSLDLSDDLKRYDLCLFSLIDRIDGYPETEIGNKENKAIKHLALYSIRSKLLERSANIFAKCEKHYSDLSGLIKGGLVSKGETLNSEMIYVLELKKNLRNPKIRDNDRRYLIRCIDKFRKYWCDE